MKIGSIGAQPPNGELGHFSSANSPRGIAVNNATGNVYVADFNNQRIDEFSSGGTPIRAWGNQVVASGPDLATPISAVQTLTVTATGGRYTLRFSGQSTGEIEAGAGKFTAIQTALTGLSSVGSGNVTVSETSSGVYKITFGGTLANTPEPLIETESGPGTPLTGGTASVANTTTGTTGFTVCNAGSDTCKVGSQTAARGGMQGPTGVAIDQSTGNVYVTEQNNRRVDEYTSSGEWIATWGLNVVSFGQDNTGTGFEICKATSNPVDICQAGAAGGIAGGAFKEPFNSGIAVEPAAPHDVLVADQTNNRVQVFSPSGEFVEAFGFDVVESGPDNTGTGFEVCKKVEGDVCKAGTGGTAVGQFGAATGASRLAADGNGNVYVVDFVNKRVLKFTPGGGTFTATEFGPSGPTATPFAVAIDPTTNNVLIGREASGGTSEMQVAEYSPSDTLLETHGVGSKISEGTASSAMSGNLAYYPSSGNILLDFISTTAPKVFILNNTPAPTVHFTEVANLSATSATFKGTVTPPAEVEGQRSEVTWRFEYSTDNAHWTKAPPVDKSAGSEPEVADPVEESVTGLRPDTTYFVRLCATTGPGSEACDPTPAREFTTLQETPTIVSTWPEEVTQTEATLGGEVDPNSLSTTYHFEWGTEPGVYTHRVPGVERHIGAGSAGVVVQEKISGLEPATEYHYRLIATNSKGTVTGTDQIVETLDTCGLPDDRCYELVSPPDKGPIGAAGDSSISAQELQFQAAPEGSAIAYQMAYGLPEATSGTEVAYLAQRSAHGWTSGQLAPAIQVPVNNTGSAVTSRVLGMASDLSCGIYVSTQPLTEGAPTAALDAGKALLYSRDASGQYALISDRVPTFINGPDTTLKEYLLVGMSEANGDNCGRVIFRTAFQYEGVPGAGRERLYEWDHGVLRNVGVIPGPSGPVVTEAVPGAISATVGAGEQHATDYWNAVSDDASRVVFSAKSQVGEDANQFAVFVRDHASGSGDLSAGSTTIEDLTTSAGSFSAGQEISGAGIPSSTTVTGVGSGSITLSQSATADGEEVALDAFRTVDASQSQTATANNGSSRYEVASDNGNYVFFAARYGLASPANGGSSTGATSCSVGTEGNPNGTGCDLYRYSLADGRLVDLSADTTDAHGASVAGVLGASEDGDRIYFAARGKLTSGGRTEAENVAGNTYGVYLWEEGDISYVGRVPNWEALWVARSGAQFTAPGKWNSRVTPDGRDLLFESNQNLTGYESGGAFEAYLFGAASGSLTCISCRHDQKPSVSSQTRLSSGGDIRDILGPPRTLAGDGGEARVFFFSEDALATGAIEGKNNLYQWEHGQVTFIGSSEPGTTNLALRFAGSSADGNDVYFTTVNRLDWEDVDGKLDVYDARVGGGFVQPPAPPAACQSLNEGSCQGVPAGTSAASAIASTAEGRGNPKAAETKKPHPHKKKRYRHRRKRHHHTRSHKRTGTDRRHAK